MFKTSLTGLVLISPFSPLCENVENPFFPLSICSSGQRNPQFPHTYPQSFRSITGYPPLLSAKISSFFS